MEFLNNKINKVSRDVLHSLINYNDKKARKAKRNEILNSFKKSNQLNKVPMIAIIKMIRTKFNNPLNYHIIIEAEGSNTTPQKTQSRINSVNSNWNEDPIMEFLMEKIENNGFLINFKIIKENKLINKVESVLEFKVDNEMIGNSMELYSETFSIPLVDYYSTSGDDDEKIIGNIEFQLILKPITKFGLHYWERLPVCDPDLKIPQFAMPSESFIHHDEFNEIIVAFVIFYWLLRGEKNSWEMLPPNIQTRASTLYQQSDQLFTSRRLNGCNRPYNNFEKVENNNNNNNNNNKAWDYELKLNLKGYEKKQDVWLPDTTCCRFKLSDDGELIIKSIAYQMNGNDELIVQEADGSDEWNELKIKYMMVEFNYNITWAHVGVHFIVEMYNMAFYRNIVNNPIKKLLYPHFDGVIFNNWLVVRPMTDGVVTKAAAFTYEGQIQMLQDKFKQQTYRWSPTPLDPIIKGNEYDVADQAIWKAISEYVDEFFIENKNEILKYWNEIELVSNDLVEHSLNPDRNASEILTLSDLRDCSVYIIYQAIFQHAIIHWKAWDDEAKAVIYNQDGATSKSDIQYYENLGNAIEAGVQYPSPYVRHWPILDIEFGGPEPLQKKIWEVAHLINPTIQIGSLIMSPNI